MNVDLYSYFYGLVQQIPRGRISTYGALARALGDIKAARACGVMLSQNPDPPKIPCHRVVMSDGTLGGFTHPLGVKRKIELLRMEGIEIENGKIADFEYVFFDSFKTDYPLKKLRKLQESMRDEIILEDIYSSEYVGGADVSYTGRRAYAALVIYRGERKIEEITLERDISFPYIPTYLAFREEPLISELLRKWNDEIILLVDGNGILHPRGMGLATYVGVKNHVSTIGVAKSLLMGEIRGEEIYLNGKVVARYLRSGKKKGIYVSSGYGVSLQSAVKIVKKYLRYKNPEPLRQAHILANALRLGIDKNYPVYR